MASLNPWGKLDEVQNERLMARRKTRKRIAIISISSIVLVSIIDGSVAALKAAPEKSKKRFVIYVKRGIYKENVRIEKTKWNIMIIGDGKYATIVTVNRNFIDGTPTFQSATFGKSLLNLLCYDS
ncbi:hypothetical protein K7X08_034100 [Anisodus acutangulus]|uniref:Pectinesterase n=1 Tax=Anisodus acutangulus TaxID=402998 RepID=A0A9Q1LZZ2_9SOLA|nr:hypothetical protein K7X08_034100 [Anisodus acutangulus]